jgi:hypothetical protein
MKSTKIQTHSFSGGLSGAQLFEIKLYAGFKKETLFFIAVQPDEESAADFGRAMLDQHDIFDVAEIWLGLKMLRRV